MSLIVILFCSNSDRYIIVLFEYCLDIIFNKKWKVGEIFYLVSVFGALKFVLFDKNK